MGRRGAECMSLKEYKKWKIKVLAQLGIELTWQQEEHIHSLEREIDIDNYCHDIIMKGEE